MIALQNYVAGAWTSGSGDAKALYNPSTEGVVGEVRPGGVAPAAALAFARDKGGPALRALTFAQRGALLKALSKKIHEHRDALIEISGSNGGNTRGDAKFDLDGCTGRLGLLRRGHRDEERQAHGRTDHTASSTRSRAGSVTRPRR